MANEKYQMPEAKFSFKVKWGEDGKQIGFSEVSGLTMETETLEYREGDDAKPYKRKHPALESFGDITMKKGVFYEDNVFFDWFKEINGKDFKKKNIDISLLDEEGNSIITWTARNAFPLKVEYPDLSADASEVAIESITVAHEELTIKHNS